MTWVEDEEVGEYPGLKLEECPVCHSEYRKDLLSLTCLMMSGKVAERMMSGLDVKLMNWRAWGGCHQGGQLGPYLADPASGH